MVVGITLGSIAFGIALVMWYFKKKGRVLTACCLIAGFAVAIPLAQIVGDPLSRMNDIAPWVMVNTVLAAAASAWLFFELKDKGTRSFTPWVALLTPCIFVLAAGPFLVPLDIVGQAATGVESALMAG